MITKTVRMSPEFLTEFITRGFKIPGGGRKSVECTAGLPSGAQLERIESITSFENDGSRCVKYIDLIYSHPSFDFNTDNNRC